METKVPAEVVAGQVPSPAARMIKIKLENCYGIKSFQEEILFEANRPIVIYAPNGAMKTSFSKTFLDLANDQLSRGAAHFGRYNQKEYHFE